MNDTLQSIIVFAIIVIAAIALIVRLRRNKGCADCDSTKCPLRSRKKE